MIRIGLVGENPNDTSTIANLLKQGIAREAHFFTMLNDVNGDDLDSDRALSLIRTEYQYTRPDLIVYIRDLDAMETDKKKIAERKAVFQRRRKRVSGRAILLLIVVESEALVFSDIEGFIRYLLQQELRQKPGMTVAEREDFADLHRSNLQRFGDPMRIPTPKEDLIARFNYDESRLSKISQHLRLPIVLQNHRGFALFFKRFLKKIEQIESGS